MVEIWSNVPGLQRMKHECPEPDPSALRATKMAPQDTGMSLGGPPCVMELAGPPIEVDGLRGPGMKLDGPANASADV